MAQHVCPWWLGYVLANPLRRLLENPRAILAPYVGEGMIVLEPGPGMGFFTLDLARLVGASGKIVAVDLQVKMLDGLRRRAAKAGLLDRIDARLAPANGLGVADLRGQVDFVLAYYVVHELPDAAAFFAEAVDVLKPAGKVLMVEPRGHVSPSQFDDELRAASQAGLTVTARPAIGRSRAVVLAKSTG
jgi:ubiquinone/menaquinone biosynthesis C-methylase UbiE